MLEVFWASHNPGERPWSRQYRAAVFVRNEEQRREALRTRDREAQRFHGPIHTEILPAGEFYLAEGYHQKYALRGDAELEKEYRAIFPNEKDFIDSTAASRVNGYVAGYGDLRQLQAELRDLGLSGHGSKHLLEIVRGYEARRGNRDGQAIACPVR